MHARIEPYGEEALLLELDEGSAVERQARLEALASSMRDEPEVREAVVGLGNLSLLLRRGSRGRIAERLLARLEAGQAEPVAGRTHEIPVRYDGEDLAELAALHGLSVEEAIGLHLAPLYRVAFLGFSPGFAYLLGLDARLRTPRLERPRALVPAGSVAIGDGFTAVYPVASPGGWRLLGRTSSTLFDPERRTPASLATGDCVRFVRDR